MLESPKAIIIEMYNVRLMTMQQIADHLRMSYGSLAKVMRKCNIVRRTPTQSRFHHLLGHFDDKIIKMYRSGSTAKKIAMALGIGPAAVYTILKRVGEKRRKFTTTIADNPIYQLSRTELVNLYLKQKMSARQIGAQFGISRTAAENLLRKQSIRLRSYIKSSSAMNIYRIPPLNEHQIQLLLGSLLGDAGLYRRVALSNKTARKLINYVVQFAHGWKQLSYLNHKRTILSGSKIIRYVTGLGKVAYRYIFAHTPTLKEFARICHNHNHKKSITKEWLDRLTWEGISYWYQDDGYLLIMKKRPIVNFCTDSFNNRELTLLQKLLRGFGLDTRRALQIPPKQTGFKRSTKKHYRLVSRHRKEAEQFLINVSPWIVPCLRYKIRWLDDKPVAPIACL